MIAGKRILYALNVIPHLLFAKNYPDADIGQRWAT
jgi:hypothetical protein